MVEVGKDLWGSPGPNSLLKQGRLQPVAWDHVQAGCEYLQGADFTTSGSTCANTVCSRHEHKWSFLDAASQKAQFCPWVQRISVRYL